MRIDNSTFYPQFPSEENAKKKPGLYEETTIENNQINPYDIDLEVNENPDSFPEGVKFPSGSCACSQGCTGGCYSNHTNCK